MVNVGVIDTGSTFRIKGRKEVYSADFVEYVSGRTRVYYTEPDTGKQKFVLYKQINTVDAKIIFVRISLGAIVTLKELYTGKSIEGNMFGFSFRNRTVDKVLVQTADKKFHECEPKVRFEIKK